MVQMQLATKILLKLVISMAFISLVAISQMLVVDAFLEFLFFWLISICFVYADFVIWPLAAIDSRASRTSQSSGGRFMLVVLVKAAFIATVAITSVLLMTEGSDTFMEFQDDFLAIILRINTRFLLAYSITWAFIVIMLVVGKRKNGPAESRAQEKARQNHFGTKMLLKAIISLVYISVVAVVMTYITDWALRFLYVLLTGIGILFIELVLWPVEGSERMESSRIIWRRFMWVIIKSVVVASAVIGVFLAVTTGHGQFITIEGEWLLINTNYLTAYIIAWLIMLVITNIVIGAS
jgi:hypothetical protein